MEHSSYAGGPLFKVARVFGEGSTNSLLPTRRPALAAGACVHAELPETCTEGGKKRSNQPVIAKHKIQKALEDVFDSSARDVRTDSCCA